MSDADSEDNARFWCPCPRCTAVRRELAQARVPAQAPEQPRAPVHALAVELDAPYEPPTANAPEDLPDPGATRYPLMRVHREQAPLGTLFAYLFRLLLWRAARWLRPWRDS